MLLTSYIRIKTLTVLRQVILSIRAQGTLQIQIQNSILSKQHIYTTKIGTFVCPPHISETVAVTIMKLGHRQRRHSFQNKFYCAFDQFYLRQFKRIGTPITPNIAQINMDNVVLLSDRSLCIILCSPLIRISAVAQRLECATDNGMFTGSNHTEVVWKLFSISFTPLNFASVFRKSTVLAMCNYRQCPQLFQDCSVKFTSIVHACVHSIIQHQHLS